MNWFLIVYFAGQLSSAQFATKADCEDIGKLMQVENGARYTCLYKG